MESDRLVRLPEVQYLCGLSRTGIYDLIGSGNFPVPVRIGTRTVGWRLSEIQLWIESRPRAAGFLGRHGIEASDE